MLHGQELLVDESSMTGKFFELDTAFGVSRDRLVAI